MKRVGMFLILLLLLATAVSAMTLTNPVPTDGTYLQGDGTELFSVDTNETATIGTLWINNAGWNFFNMDCTSGTECEVIPDLTGYPDLTNYDFYFVVDSINEPPFPNVYDFTIDRTPVTPTGLTCAGLTESSLRLDWDDNPESDIQYYELDNGTDVVYSGNASAYDDTGLAIGVNYTYSVRAVDDRNQTSNWTSTVTCSPMDMTPPVQPNVVLPSPATYNTMTPSINISYAENVSLRIYSGDTFLQSLGWGVVHTWNPTFFTSDGVYNFNFRAMDAYLNEVRTNYTLTIDTVSSNASVSIGDIVHLMGADDPTVVKGNALSTTPNDYWIISWDMSMYGGRYIRATLDDLASVSQSIDIDSESAPFIFCEEDYDSLALDFDGVGVTYDVLNTYDETSTALNCVDTDPSGEVQYTVYMKIPVPSGLNSDDFTLAWEFGLYDEVI
ncbi:fibronectin type III domain-containing protein [Thermoproteota archaeon]